ncbi:MAG TPA: hypothetical protein VG101_10040 [Puia sp.]|nr:hypothetical protein [Puia sp.]
MVYYTTLTVICLSFLSSLIAFRLDYPFHLKLISGLLGFTVISELFITKLIHHIWKGTTNIPWYNIVMLVEFFVYAWYYYCILKNKALRKIILAYLIILPISWFILTFRVFHLTNWNSHIDIAGSIFTVCLSVALYHQLFTAPELVRLSKSPEFWIATALILYYSGSLPFTSMLDFLTEKVRPLAKSFVTILQILNILLYTLIGYAYLCRIKTKK